MQPEMQLETTAGVPALPATPAAEPSPRWNPALLIAFRFAFSYLLLYNVSTFIDLFPFTDSHRREVRAGLATLCSLDCQPRSASRSPDHDFLQWQR